MNKLKFYRNELGIPLDALAHVTGLSRWVIRAIETGYRKASQEEQEILARFLGIKSKIIFPYLAGGSK